MISEESCALLESWPLPLTLSHSVGNSKEPQRTLPRIASPRSPRKTDALCQLGETFLRAVSSPIQHSGELPFIHNAVILFVRCRWNIREIDREEWATSAIPKGDHVARKHSSGAALFAGQSLLGKVADCFWTGAFLKIPEHGLVGLLDIEWAVTE